MRDVTEPADLTHDVLLRVAEFLRRLPADQIADLAAGAAKLEVVPRGGRPAAGPAAAVPLPRPPKEIDAELSALGDRAAGARYLDGLGLTVSQLRALARALGIAVASRATKAQARDTIVQWTVGRRLDSAVLSRPAVIRHFEMRGSAGGNAQ